MWNAKVSIWCPLQGTTSRIPISWIVSAETKPYRQVIPPLITRVGRRAMWIIPVSVLERSYRVIYRRRLPFLERSPREWCAVGFRPHNERRNCVIVGKDSQEYLKNRRHSASISARSEREQISGCCSRCRHREAVCGPDSRRRNAGARHRPDRGAALWQPDYRLRRLTRSRPIE